MAVNKYITNNAGVLTEVTAPTTSAGAGDSGKIPALNGSGVLDATLVNSKTTSVGAGDSGKLPALNASGQLDSSFLPTGIGAETASIATSESLAAGNLVNIYNIAGTATVRKSDATTVGKEASGFVLAAFTHPTTAIVYLAGINTGVAGLTPGKQFLNTTAGGCVATAPSASGNVVQDVGYAVSATALAFQPKQPVVLA
jgi:hypothetical protein